MSWLTVEQKAVKQTIAINPITITINRPGVGTNSRGVSYQDWNNSTSIPIINSVRIALMNKPGSKIQEVNGKYNNTKTYYIVFDFETTLQKHDRFTYNNKDWEILDVENITISGGIVNYQAELKDLTQKLV